MALVSVRRELPLRPRFVVFVVRSRVPACDALNVVFWIVLSMPCYVFCRVKLVFTSRKIASQSTFCCRMCNFSFIPVIAIHMGSCPSFNHHLSSYTLVPFVQIDVYGLTSRFLPLMSTRDRRGDPLAMAPLQLFGVLSRCLGKFEHRDFSSLPM